MNALLNPLVTVKKQIVFYTCLCVGLLLNLSASLATPCTTPPSSIVHWWPGNGNTDDIVGSTPGTLINGTTYVPAEVCLGFSFDGVNDSVNFGNTNGNFGTNDFTVEFWIKTSSTRHEAIISKRAACGANSFFSLRLNGSGAVDWEICQDVFANNYNGYTGTNIINDGFFHHIAATRKGTNTALYVDGVLDTTQSTTGITVISNAAPILAGDEPCIGNDGTEFFTGVLDEISIYYRALTLTEIQDIFNSGENGKCNTNSCEPYNPTPCDYSTNCITPPSDMVNWWPADNSGDDIVGTDHGTLSGTTYTPAVVCMGFSFDGVDDTVDFGTTAGNFETNDFTIEFWIQTSSTRHEAILGKRDYCGAASFFSLRLNESGALDWEICEDGFGSNYNGYTGTNIINDGYFHHVAATRQGTNTFLYIDGALDSSNSSAGVTYISNESSFLAGVGPCNGVDGTEFFTGILDEISIYHRALSIYEIQDIFNAGTDGKCH